MTLREQLIQVATIYAQAAGLASGSASRRVFKDGKTLPRLMAGGDVTTGTFESAMAWFAANWPADLDWPSDIPRPAPQQPNEAAA